MKFQQALGEAISKDVLFMQVDCGAFTPYRWNPTNWKVEYWSPRDNRWLEANVGYGGVGEDWVVTERLRSKHEKIIYASS